MGEADAPPAPLAAAEIFGEALPLAERYVELLADSGIVRGLIGPRETPRLWDRHVLNCAVVAAELLPGASLADVGSGAGLPGIPMALARNDLMITLIEPLQRRTVWLEEVVADLGIGDRVTVLRSRAENAPRGTFDVVTSRAVAALDKLSAVSLPLLRPGGIMLALKGERATEELANGGRKLARLGAVAWGVDQVGGDRLDVPTSVLWVRMSGSTLRGSAGRHGES